MSTFYIVPWGYLTTRQAAERMGVSQLYVSRLVHLGRLNPIRIGDEQCRLRLFPVAEIERYIQGHPRLGRRRSR